MCTVVTRKETLSSCGRLCGKRVFTCDDLCLLKMGAYLRLGLKSKRPQLLDLRHLDLLFLTQTAADIPVQCLQAGSRAALELCCARSPCKMYSRLALSHPLAHNLLLGTSTPSLTIRHQLAEGHGHHVRSIVGSWQPLPKRRSYGLQQPSKKQGA